jgi:hypothetical protein
MRRFLMPKSAGGGKNCGGRRGIAGDDRQVAHPPCSPRQRKTLDGSRFAKPLASRGGDPE